MTHGKYKKKTRAIWWLLPCSKPMYRRYLRRQPSKKILYNQQRVFLKMILLLIGLTESLWLDVEGWSTLITHKPIFLNPFIFYWHLSTQKKTSKINVFMRTLKTFHVRHPTSTSRITKGCILQWNRKCKLEQTIKGRVSDLVKSKLVKTPVKNFPKILDPVKKSKIY